jgi:DNA polymerase-3 subunit alpha
VDFLGLSTLTIMAHACDLIEKRHGILHSLSSIPLDDAETFQFLGQGKTAGVFQLEGAGMTRYLTQMRPRSLANIIAMVALFRPGPMEFIPAYIRRMHGEEEISYRHPGLEPILKETFGIPIYQEQIMFAAMALAGYSASEADDLRKAISKKKAEAIMEHRQKFILGAFRLGIAEQVAGDIFTDWENFARYGFNKSHAADYGIIAVETAFLKTHYTVEYMTALLSGAKNDTSKVAYYAADCRSMAIDVLPPDVSISGWDFTIEDRVDKEPAIRFGLGAIKNVGQGPVDMVLRARTDGVFKDLKDFARRVDLRQLGKRPLECLIKVGALDSFGPRPALLQAMENILSHSTYHFRSMQSGQLSFFGNVEGVEDEIVLPKEVNLDRRDQLEWEKELIGLYISDHPLSPYMSIINQKISHFSGQLGEVKDKEKVRVAGMVTRFRSHQTKTGQLMGFVTLEDIQGSIELLLFPKIWEKFGNLVETDLVLYAAGRLDAEGKEAKILVDELEIVSLSELPEFDPDLPVTAEDGRTEIEGQEPWDKPSVPAEEWLPSEGPAVEVCPLPMLEHPTISQAIGTIDNFVGQEPWIETQVESQVADQGSISAVAEEPGSMFAFVPQANPQVLPEVREGNPRVLTVVLNTTGDRDRDIRRMRRVHGLLRSRPGNDRFSFLLMEGFHQYHIDFPNDMIGISTELMDSLLEMVGPDNVWVK